MIEIDLDPSRTYPITGPLGGNAGIVGELWAFGKGKLNIKKWVSEPTNRGDRFKPRSFAANGICPARGLAILLAHVTAGNDWWIYPLCHYFARRKKRINTNAFTSDRSNQWLIQPTTTYSLSQQRTTQRNPREKCLVLR
jgi:hypothetical protein